MKLLRKLDTLGAGLLFFFVFLTFTYCNFCFVIPLKKCVNGEYKGIYI